MGFFIDGCKEVGDHGCRGHPHSDAFMVVDVNVTELHPVVVHNNVQCFNA